MDSTGLNASQIVWYFKSCVLRKRKFVTVLYAHPALICTAQPITEYSLSSPQHVKFLLVTRTLVGLSLSLPLSPPVD